MTTRENHDSPFPGWQDVGAGRSETLHDERNTI